MIQRINLLLTSSERPYYMRFNLPPLAIGILQGYLRGQGYQVNATDLNVVLAKKCASIPRERWLPLYKKNVIIKYLLEDTHSEIEDLMELLTSEIDISSSDIIGISAGANFSFFEIHLSFLLGKFIKKIWGKPIVFGGDNIQYLWQFRNEFQEIWEGIGINFPYLFVGPGERSFSRLIDWLNHREGSLPYEELPGAVIVQNGQITHNPQDLPSLHKPDFHGLDLKAYTTCVNAGESLENQNLVYFYKWSFPHTLMASEVNRRRLSESDRKEVLFIPYIFNYNCPFSCAFCVQSRDNKPKTASKDAKTVVNDLERLMQEYDTQYFYFFNNTFNYTRKFTEEFCQLVLEKGLKFYWSDCARFNDLTLDLIGLLYRAGCRKLVFGFETGSEKILKLIDKRLDLQHARNVLKWCHEIGIWAEVEVIVGLPHEYEEDFLETYSFMEENIKNKYITGFQLNKYFVVPVSLIARFPERYGIQLVRIKNSYEKLLEQSANNFLRTHTPKDEKVAAANFQVYRFNEINGRSYQEIIKDTNEKALRISRLYSKLETSDEIRIYQFMNSFQLGKIV